MYIIVYIYIFIRYPSEIKQSFISWTFANRFTFTYRGGPKKKPVRTHSSTACNHQLLGTNQRSSFNLSPYQLLLLINCPQICVNLKITKPWFLRVSGVRGLGL